MISTFFITALIEESLLYLNPNSKGSGDLLWLYSLICVWPERQVFSQQFIKPGRVAMALGMQAVLRSTPPPPPPPIPPHLVRCKILVRKIFLRPFFLFRWFKKSTCQLMVKEYTLSSGKLPPGSLPRNSVVRITDQPNITSAVYYRGKATNQTSLNDPQLQVKGIGLCGYYRLPGESTLEEDKEDPKEKKKAKKTEGEEVQ